MKKITAVALALIMALALLAGCGGGTTKLTPAEQYQQVLDASKAAGATSTDMDMDMVMKVAYSGISMDITMNSNFKIDATDAAAPKMAATMNMNIPGAGETVMNYYYDGAYIYIDMSGMKYKAAMSAEDAQGLMQQSDTSLMDASVMKDITVETVDGDKVFSYTLDTSADGIISQMLGDSLGDMDGASITINEFTGTSTVGKDNAVKATTVHAVMNIVASGQSMDMDMDMNIKINATGSSVKVELPADLDTYTEVDAAQLTGEAA